MGIRGVKRTTGRLRRRVGAVIATLLIPLFLVSATQAGEERFDYDPLGRLIRVIDEQNRVTEYVYDPAGNLLQVITTGTATAPTVSGITPDALRRGESKQVVVTGSSLTGVRLSTADPGLSITDTTIAATQISFTLSASSTAILGPQPIVFTNAAGSTSAAVSVNPLLPKVSVAPAPLAIPPDNTARQFTIRLSNPDNIDHSFALSVSNAAIIAVSPASVTIPAGQTEAKANLTGITGGLATITLTSTTLGVVQAPVFVTAEFRGINTSNALLLGVVVEEIPPPKPPQTITPFGAAHLGVVVGGHLYSINPKAVVIGTGPTNLTIYGKALEGVTTVAVNPSEGVTLGTPVAAADGNSLTVPITVAASASMGMRQVVLNAGTQTIPASRPDADRILIAPPAPEVTSVDPLFAIAGVSAQTLVIRGRNFQNLQSIAIAPSSGIVIGASPVINAAATEITLKLAISPIATVGPRVITVTTASGVSSAIAAPENTFTLVNELQETYAPINAALLGVTVEQTPAPPTADTYGLTSTHLGVTVGSAVTGITPAVESIGASFTMTVVGSELQNVTAVEIFPNTGITAGTPTVAADGKSLTLPVTIATDAPLTLRAVRVLAGTTLLPSAPASATQFRVTTPTPEVHSVGPNFVQLGAPAGTHTIRGKNFHNATQVKLVPPEGVTISPPTVNGAATEITVNLSAATSAVKGKRAIVVVTPVGETSSELTPANTLILATDAETITPVSAAHLGVVVEQIPQPVSTPVAIDAAILGVNVEIEAPPPVASTVFLGGTRLGVAVGAVATSVSPPGMARGDSAVLTIQGMGLTAVTNVALNPATGITLGAMTANADGTQLSVPVTVAADAPTGLHEVILTGATFSTAAAGRFYIATGTPQLDSIAPILATVDSVATLTIRGANLHSATAVSATPSESIVFGSTITVNAAGTELTIPIYVPADAPLGSCVIQVTTPAGTSTADPIPANTFTVVPP